MVLVVLLAHLTGMAGDDSPYRVTFPFNGSPPEIPSPTNAILVLWTPAFLVWRVPTTGWATVTGECPLSYALQRAPGCRPWGYCFTKGDPGGTEVLGASTSGDLLVGFRASSDPDRTHRVFRRFAVLPGARCGEVHEVADMPAAKGFQARGYDLDQVQVNYPARETVATAQQKRLMELAESLSVSPSAARRVSTDAVLIMDDPPEATVKRARLYAEFESDTRQYPFTVAVAAWDGGASYAAQLPVTAPKCRLDDYAPERLWPVVRVHRDGITYWNGREWATNGWSHAVR